MIILKIAIFLLYLVTGGLYLYFGWNISFLSIALAVSFFWIASVFHMVLHEYGHLIGGWISGYKLVLLTSGFINLKQDRKGKLSLSIGKTYGGQCIMLPGDHVPIRYKAYNAGGIIINLFYSLVGLGLIIPDIPWLRLLAIALFFAGWNKVLSNLIPRLHHSIPNDGYILRLLKKRPAVQYDYARYLNLYATMFWKEPVQAEEYSYERETAESTEELLYYHGIQDLLSDLDDQTNTAAIQKDQTET